MREELKVWDLDSRESWCAVWLTLCDLLRRCGQTDRAQSLFRLADDSVTLIYKRITVLVKRVTTIDG